MIVLEISAVAEYFGKLFNPLLRKIKKSVFHDRQKPPDPHIEAGEDLPQVYQKTIF